MKLVKTIFLSLLSLALVACGGKDSTESDPDPQPEKGLAADLFDLSVSSDASASDASKMRSEVVTNSAFSLSSYYNADYKRYAACFGGTPGKSVGCGYYRVDYTSNEALRAALADGFTAELLFCCDALPTGTSEASVFSSVEGAGFGFGVTSTSAGNHIKFDIYASKLITLDSKMTPQPGIFYHLVAVYDAGTGKVSLYVDGVLKAEASAGGDLVMPSAQASSWFCIGGDCSSSLNYAEKTWQGEVVNARLYSSALGAADVTTLYRKVQRSSQTGGRITLTDLGFLTDCHVAAGWKYYIYADGFAAGDAVKLQNAQRSIDCRTTVGAGCLIVTVPSSLTTGNWSLVLDRGGVNRTLGTVKFTVEAAPALPRITKVFAHRCVHNNTKGPYENSLEALKKTQTYGVHGAEFDVWITTDGYVVVHHDATVSGKNIQNSRWSDLKNIKLPTGEHLPLLSEFLDQGLAYPGVILNFEIKAHTDNDRNRVCADSVAVMLNARNMVSQCRMMSYSTVALDELRRKVPALQLDYLGTDDPSFPQGKGYNGISYNMNLLSAHPDWVARCHAAGMKVCTWTPSSSQDIMTFINLGVDYITVNSVDLAKSLTERPYVSY